MWQCPQGTFSSRNPMSPSNSEEWREIALWSNRVRSCSVKTIGLRPLGSPRICKLFLLLQFVESSLQASSNFNLIFSMCVVSKHVFSCRDPLFHLGHLVLGLVKNWKKIGFVFSHKMLNVPSFFPIS